MQDVEYRIFLPLASRGVEAATGNYHNGATKKKKRSVGEQQHTHGEVCCFRRQCPLPIAIVSEGKAPKQTEQRTHERGSCAVSTTQKKVKGTLKGYNIKHEYQTTCPSRGRGRHIYVFVRGGGGGLPTPTRIYIWGKTRFSTKGENVLPQDQIKKKKSRK